MNAQGNPPPPVKVPGETCKVEKLLEGAKSLKYVERKPWKYQTKKKFKFPIKGYDIWVPSSKCPGKRLDGAFPSSLITLKVKQSENGSDERRVSEIVIKKGYAWDGASGPTFDTCGSFQAALVHDALYQCMRLGYVTQDSRKAVDRLLLDMLRLGGMWPARRFFWYLAVCLFGKKAAMSKPHKSRTIPGFVALTLGCIWLAHWVGSKCWPTRTEGLVDCLREVMCLGDNLNAQGQWICWIENVLTLVTILVPLFIVCGILYALFRGFLAAPLRTWLKKHSNSRPLRSWNHLKGVMNRKYIGAALYALILVVIILVLVAGATMCFQAQTVDCWDWPALITAVTLAVLGVELLIGDCCATGKSADSGTSEQESASN